MPRRIEPSIKGKVNGIMIKIRHQIPTIKEER